MQLRAEKGSIGMDAAARISLPRSLSPLECESLPGYVLRLAHRLRRSPARIGQVTGLVPPRLSSTGTGVARGYFPVHQLVELRPHTLAAFAAATRLAPEEAAALGLRRLAPAYPPLARAGAQGDGRVLAISWALLAASRFCPMCLVGDRSPVQRAHGGPWLQRWHLPVIFACTRHHRVLETDCPKCARPMGSSGKHRSTLILHPVSEALHPGLCRHHDADAPTRRPRILCGADLSGRRAPSPTLSPDQMAPYLALQRRIERQLNFEDRGSSYFDDLIMVAQLIKLSWPTAADLVPMPSFMSDVLDAHIEGVQRTLAKACASNPRSGELGGPPHQALPCAALLLQADQLRSVGGPSELYAAMQTLAEQAFRQNNRRFLGLFKNPSLSEPLARALAPQHRGFLARGSRRATDRLRLPSRAAQFSTLHVPQLIPLGWYHRHFEGFAEQLTVPSRDNVTFIRRAASLKLVEVASGSAVSMCAQLLDMPRSIVRSSLTQLRGRCPDGAWAQFQEAVEAIAHEIEQDPARIDFAHRRQRMAQWDIPIGDWRDLTRDLRLQVTEPRHRRAGSVIVWTRATDGDHLFCPLVRAEGIGERLPDTKAVLRQASKYFTRQTSGHVALQGRLERYADQVAARCDLNAPLSGVDTTACLRR